MISAYRYGHNLLGQRVRAELAGGERWEYGYDELGQVTSGVKKSAPGEALAGYGFGYSYDDIGNRQETRRGRPQSPLVTQYRANTLNQYESREGTRQFGLLGRAASEAIVTINETTATRQASPEADQSYFYGELDWSGRAEPARGIWDEVKVEAEVPGAGDQGTAAVAEETGHEYAAPEPEQYGYDEDGNLVRDSRWLYRWDAENRLIEMETAPIAQAAGVPREKLVFRYDGQSRRIEKRVSAWSAATQGYQLTRIFHGGRKKVAKFCG